MRVARPRRFTVRTSARANRVIGLQFLFPSSSPSVSSRARRRKSIILSHANQARSLRRAMPICMRASVCVSIYAIATSTWRLSCHNRDTFTVTEEYQILPRKQRSVLAWLLLVRVRGHRITKLNKKKKIIILSTERKRRFEWEDFAMYVDPRETKFL